ncbi:MAG: hypothetical protein JSV43_05810 [Methanobacteriota archaeon]|nr:MAG: hypothetical protein JSV43_05810 [Euryarchaeota archaeon]
MESVLKKHGLTEDEARERIRIARQNVKWFNSNVDSLRALYARKFVAVHKNRILDSDVDFDALMKRLKEEQRDLDVVDIRYVPSEDAHIVI